jgi:hypothetical protein
VGRSLRQTNLSGTLSQKLGQMTGLSELCVHGQLHRNVGNVVGQLHRNVSNVVAVSAFVHVYQMRVVCQLRFDVV